MNLQIAKDTETPIYRRIADAVCEAVTSGRAQPGAKLPAHMVLAKQLGVNALTVSRGYELLETQGVVFQKRGSGTYIALDAMNRTKRVEGRKISTLVVVLGETSLAKCLRETLFIVVNMLDGVRDVFANQGTSMVFVESFTRECLGGVGDDDAVLILAPRKSDPDLAEELVRRRIPVASVELYKELKNIPNVRYDQVEAAELACQHLVDCNYKRIGFIGVKTYSYSPVAPKFQALTSVLHNAGLDILARYIRQAFVNPGKAYAAVREIISSGDLPEAFFVDTDYKAMEVINALNDAGIRVPQDIAIVSYDDIPEAVGFSPSLTSVSIPRYEMGRIAAQILLNWPSDGTQPANVVLHSKLVVRESSGATKVSEPVIENVVA